MPLRVLQDQITSGWYYYINIIWKQVKYLLLVIMYISVLAVSILYFFMIFFIGVWNGSDRVVFFVVVLFYYFLQPAVGYVIPWQAFYLILSGETSHSQMTNVVSSNPAHGELYSIQHYVIKIVSDLRQVCCFLQVLRFPPPIKLTTTI